MTTFTSRLDNILKDFANIDRKNSGLNVYQFVIIVLILGGLLPPKFVSLSN